MHPLRLLPLIRTTWKRERCLPQQQVITSELMLTAVFVGAPTWWRLEEILEPEGNLIL